MLNGGTPENRTASAVLLGWCRQRWKAILSGLLFGALWGFLAGAGSTPSEWLVYDREAGVVFGYLETLDHPIVIPAGEFFERFNKDLIQVVLTHLFLAGIAGWATLKIFQRNPRGEEQPPLRLGTDWYVISLAVGGYAAVLLFRNFELAQWFKGERFTPVRIVSFVLGAVLPIYAGVSLFLVWFLRLDSVKAPDWDTHYPEPKKGRLSAIISAKLSGLLDRKGGDRGGH